MSIEEYLGNQPRMISMDINGNSNNKSTNVSKDIIEEEEVKLYELNNFNEFLGIKVEASLNTTECDYNDEVINYDSVDMPEIEVKLEPIYDGTVIQPTWVEREIVIPLENYACVNKENEIVIQSENYACVNRGNEIVIQPRKYSNDKENKVDFQSGSDMDVDEDNLKVIQPGNYMDVDEESKVVTQPVNNTDIDEESGSNLLDNLDTPANKTPKINWTTEKKIRWLKHLAAKSELIADATPSISDKTGKAKSKPGIRICSEAPKAQRNEEKGYLTGKDLIKEAENSSKLKSNPFINHFNELRVLNGISDEPLPTREPANGILNLFDRNILMDIVENGDLEVFNMYMADKKQCIAFKERILGDISYLLHAIRRKQYALISVMLAKGADIFGCNMKGTTPLMVACENDDPQMISFLVNNGAHMNIKPDGSNNTLFMCIWFDRCLALRALLELGADFECISHNPNLSVSHYAISLERKRIGETFRDFYENLIKKTEYIILQFVGKTVKLVNRLYGPRVISIYEQHTNSIDLIFPGITLNYGENNCNMLFIITGCIEGSTMDCKLSDLTNITSVELNEIEQPILARGKYPYIVSFCPLRKVINKIKLKYNHEHNRKVRLILCAYQLQMVN